jgi:predicted RNA-binding Zn-ribbon protein involved in translation (DUF1610 family)
MKGSIMKTNVTLITTIFVWWSCDAFSSNGSARFSSDTSKVRHRIFSLHEKSIQHVSSSIHHTSVSKISNYGQALLQRTDALRIAGFSPNEPNSKSIDTTYPLLSGLKAGLLIFAIAVGMKFYRAFFVNKLNPWERQPAWGSVITSKEDEEKSNLEAMTCNNCGSTLFIAKGRKWFQFPTDYECYACGAKGAENFTNMRREIKETFDDDEFEYQNPLDLLSSSEKRKLMKLAGGDEAKAAQLLAQKASGDDVNQAKLGEGSKTNVDTKAEPVTGMKKGSSKPEEDLDLLGMDE